MLHPHYYKNRWCVRDWAPPVLRNYYSTSTDIYIFYAVCHSYWQTVPVTYYAVLEYLFKHLEFFF